MADIGLTAGLQVLRQHRILLDCTIKVKHQEFEVHKGVLASVSKYFRTMFSGSRGSATNNVEFKDMSPEAFSKILDLIYTTNEYIIRDHSAEILGCALYLKMDEIAARCINNLLSNLHGHSIDTLSLFLKHSLYDEAEKVKKFMQKNRRETTDECKAEKLSYGVLEIVINVWDKSEWDLFQLIHRWVEIDSKKRKPDLNTFMSCVRFALMTPKEILAVRKTNVYTNCGGSWQDLVGKATDYHSLPVHQKVLDESDQSKLRTDASPVFFTTSASEQQSTFCALDKDNCWKKNRAVNTLELGISEMMAVALEVNNFLITSTGLWKKLQKWFIFNPRTMSWSEMASPCRAKNQFALVHHAEHLYLLGGCINGHWRPDSVIKVVEQYSFQTNTWCHVKKMPKPVAYHAACVVGDAIYTCGGEFYRLERGLFSSRLDRLDVVSQRWKSKAPMLTPRANHVMHVMTIGGEETIVVIDREFQIDFYNPVTDQWSRQEFTFRNEIPGRKWRDETVATAKGNTVYFLSALAHVPYGNKTSKPKPSEAAERKPSEKEKDLVMKYVGLKWEFREDQQVIVQDHFGVFPVSSVWSQKGVRPFGAMLSLPSEALQNVIDEKEELPNFVTKGLGCAPQ